MARMNNGLDNGATVVGRINLRANVGVDRIMAHWPKGDDVEYIVATHVPGNASWSCAHYFKTEGAAWLHFANKD